MRELSRRLLRLYPGSLLAILVMTLLNAGLEGVGLSLLMPIVEGLQSPSDITPSHPFSQFLVSIVSRLGLPVNLWVLLVSALFLFTLQALFQYLRVDLVSQTSTDLEARLRIGLFSDLLGARVSYFDQRKIGDLTNVLITEADRARVAFRYLVDTLVDAGLVIAYLIIAFIIAWKLSLVAFLLVAPLLYVTRRRRSIHHQGEEIRRANDALQSVTVEYLLGIRESKLLGIESSLQDTFDGLAKQVGHRIWRLERLQARFRYAYKIVATLLLLLFIGLAFFYLDTPVAEIVVYMAILFRLSPLVTQFQANRDKLLGHLPGAEAVIEVAGEARDCWMLREEGAKKPIDFEAAIELCEVSLTYEGRSEPSLQKVNLIFSKGQITAIVGASGAGKSTLVDLLARLYDPTEGHIIVDGTDLREIDGHAWRAMVGVVSQGTFLYHDTVLKNIWYGNLDASEQEVREASRLAHAHEFILELPQGYQTMIGDRGVRLSGGQRQRLAIARAILRDPAILILDEATSDLDSRSERLIHDSLRKLSRDRTVIVVAHRLSTIENVDKIVVLEQGRVVEQGSHQALLTQGGLYAEYYRLQASPQPATQPGP